MDNPARYAELARILQAALRLPPSERSAFLADATDDPELAREAEQLLQEDDRIEEPVEPARAVTDVIEILSGLDSETDAVGLGPGEQVGPFTLLEELGRGGMGAVYLAEQSEPVHRRVALKVIGRAPDGQASLRFEAEREALARLNHVNIAALYEAGTAEDGTLFFAMEFVDGEPINRYCDSARLDVRSRLLLFRSVCLGVAHAHQKGILHRDLNPSNILVAESDDRVEPKIIDFGIAKSLDQPLIDPLETGLSVLGTPAFMSPESLGLSDQLDTRSDIYALGVLLYELVADIRPVGERNDSTARLMHRMVREEPRGLIEGWEELDPEEQQAVAAQRGTTPRSLGRLLEGDLGSAALRAVARRPEERYESVRELLAALDRCFDDQPAPAGLPATPELQGKPIGRRRGLAAAAFLSAGVLLLVSIGTTAGLLKARQAEERARVEARAALEARDQTREINDFLTEVLQASGARHQDAQPPSEITARELLELGSERIETDFRDRPLLSARLRQILAQACRELALYDEARRHLQAASVLLSSEGRMDEARVLMEEAREIQRRMSGEDRPD